MNTKHDANIKKGKLINFQIAIIALLSFTYVMHEVLTYKEVKTEIAKIDRKIIPIEINDPNYRFEVESEKLAEQPKSKPIKKSIVTKTIEKKVIDNSTPEVAEPKEKPEEKPIETESGTTDTKKSPKIAPTSTSTKKSGTSKKGAKIFNPRTVKYLPVFPGCDRYSNNNDRAKCFQEKVQKLVLRKFNNGLGEDLGLKGVQKIYLYFEINEKGKVTNIKARSKSHQALAKEAMRVANLLPVMKPASDGIQNVKMSYNLPITFNVKN